MENNYIEELEKYQSKLEELENKCAQAEREKIVSETKLKNYREQLEGLISQAEGIAMCDYNEIDALIDKEYSEIKDMMDSIYTLSNFNDLPADQITQEINAITNKYRIEEG